MSVHAAGDAVRAAAHEAHVTRAAVAARARHQPRGGRRAHAARAPAYDRAERASSATAVNAADSGPQHLSIVRRWRRTPASIPSLGRAASPVVFGFHAEPPESYAVAGLQEKPVVGDLLGRNLRRVAESNYRDAIDRLVVGDDSPYAYSGVDCETSSATSHYNAIREEYTSPETGPADCHSACCPPACRKLGRAASSTFIC